MGDVTGFKVLFSNRDQAVAEARAKSEDSFLRIINSYTSSIGQKDPAFFAQMPSTYIEYLCQLAYEGKIEEGMPLRSQALAESIGEDNLKKLQKYARGMINALGSVTGEKADAITRKAITKELLLHHINRVRTNQHYLNNASGHFRVRSYEHLDEEHFAFVLQRKSIRNIVWDEATQTSRFRCNDFSDVVKIKDLNLTAGHNWQHLRLQVRKTWNSELSNWLAFPKSSRLVYLREVRR